MPERRGRVLLACTHPGQHASPYFVRTKMWSPGENIEALVGAMDQAVQLPGCSPVGSYAD